MLSFSFSDTKAIPVRLVWLGKIVADILDELKGILFLES